jgi:hypothetical protein
MKYLLTITLLSLFLFSCETEIEKEDIQPEKKIQQLNPNGDSELALLMRKMADEFTAMKPTIDEGGEIEAISDYKTIQTATPTKENMIEGGYQSYALGFLLAIEDLENSTQSTQEEAYNAVINACKNCHLETCPGPIRRIEKMYAAEFIGTGEEK